MTFSTSMYLVSLILVLIQVLAALPWVWMLFLGREDVIPYVRKWLERLRTGDSLARQIGLYIAGAVVGVFVAPFLLSFFGGTGGTLENLGYAYAVVLQIQLSIDAYILAFVVLLLLWPKGGAIALAAFREGVRQPMFWLLFAIAFTALGVSPFIPYFTFGEDHLVVREIGFDTIMLFAMVFGALAASMSVSEEIEGRTAVTLMSKPVSRRHFLIGKFLGIALAASVFFALLGIYFQAITLFKPFWDKMDPESTPLWITEALTSWKLTSQAADMVRGIGLWTHSALTIAPGLILGFSQVLVMVALSVSLATRLPMVVNLVTVVVFFFLAHLTPVLVDIGKEAQRNKPGAIVSQILYFMSQLLDTILPNLDYFRIDPALLNETPIGAFEFASYLTKVSTYGILFTSIMLLFGLILFEDRDLA
jgi:ABC-type transport system involved in multi-copper enzyme maturation permease subunit